MALKHPAEPGTDPAFWLGEDMAKRDDWIYVFSNEEITALEDAVERMAGAGRDLLSLGREDAEIAGLSRTLAAMAEEVVWGRGFVLLRGLPAQDWDRRKLAYAYWVIGLHFGLPVPQNAAGHLLGHVKDLGLDPENPVNRIYQTRYRHLFHTDSCDIVGLMCLQKAKAGGLSRIVSSTALYREIQARRPDLAEPLKAPFIHDRKGETPEGAEPYYAMPIVHEHDGYVTVIYARDFIEAAQERFADIPRLSARQVEAMDLLDELAADPRFYLDMAFAPGDIQFLHNHQILHARTAYEDWPEPERKRHLWRLWLSTPEGRPLPKAMEPRYGPIEPGRPRGGIRVPGQRLSAPLDVR